MPAWPTVAALLAEGARTSCDLALELDVSVRVTNSRLQSYRVRGVIAPTGRLVPKTGGPGRRPLFWRLTPLSERRLAAMAALT